MMPQESSDREEDKRFFGEGVFDWQLVQQDLKQTWHERSYNPQRWWGDFPPDLAASEECSKNTPGRLGPLQSLW